MFPVNKIMKHNCSFPIHSNEYISLHPLIRKVPNKQSYYCENQLVRHLNGKNLGVLQLIFVGQL